MKSEQLDIYTLFSTKANRFKRCTHVTIENAGHMLICFRGPRRTGASSEMFEKECIYNMGNYTTPKSTMDIRYNFLNTLDHFPCELIRTLWVIQSLDIQRESGNGDEWTNTQLVSQSELLGDLVRERISALTSHKQDLMDLVTIRKKYNSMLEKRNERTQAEATKSKPKLTIKLRLKEKQAKQQDLETRVKKSEIGTEETYCICHNVSYGAMIACDNPKCPTEWFHYGCVGITKPPQGKWYCSDACGEQAQNKRRPEARRKRRGKRRKLN